jgi:hypothetical protein
MMSHWTRALSLTATAGLFVSVAAEARAVGTASCAETDCASAASDCQCDGACTTYGDCCGDYAGVCGPALGPALDAASAADIFVTRSNDEVSQSIIPGFWRKLVNLTCSAWTPPACRETGGESRCT